MTVLSRLLLIVMLAAGPRQDAGPVIIAKDAIQPCLVAGSDGTFFCTFLRGGNIEVSTSADRGSTWSAPVVAIDAKGKARGGMQRGPRIGVDTLGRITVTAPVCFDEKELEARYPKADLWAVRSTDDGRTFSPPVQINEKAGTAPEALHAMAVAPSGDVHVAWLDMRGRAKGQDLYYSRVVDGKPGANVKVASTLCECCAPGIAVDDAGRIAIAWRDGAARDDRPILVSRSKDGATFTAPARVNRGETRVAG